VFDFQSLAVQNQLSVDHLLATLSS